MWVGSGKNSVRSSLRTLLTRGRLQTFTPPLNMLRRSLNRLFTGRHLQRRACRSGVVNATDNSRPGRLDEPDQDSNRNRVPSLFAVAVCAAIAAVSPSAFIQLIEATAIERLATGSTICRSRSGLRLWRCRHPAASSNGYTGSADLATVAMAKRIFGEADRFDPTGLS